MPRARSEIVFHRQHRLETGRILAFVLAGFCGANACTSTDEPYGKGGIVSSIGGRFLFDDLWEDADSQFAIGAEIDWIPPGWPLGFEASFHATGTNWTYSTDGVEGDLQDVSVGVRKTFEPLGTDLQHVPLFLYVGGGATWLRAQLQDFEGLLGFPQSDRDDTVGFYTHAGIGFEIKDGATFGFDLRYFSADVDLFGESADVDSIQPSLFVGLRW